MPNLKSQRFASIFSSKSFIVLAFMFDSLIHFELVFENVVRQGPS